MSALSESPVPEIGTPGSMSGGWKRSYGEGTRAPPDERGGKQTTRTYGHRATSRLYSLSPKLAENAPPGLD
jgi:hypothetical protein